MRLHLPVTLHTPACARALHGVDVTHQHSDDDGTVVHLRPEYANHGTDVAIQNGAALEESDYLEGEIVDDWDDEQPNPVVEHAGFVVAGIIVVSRRTWDASSSTLYNQMIRAATAIGDTENALEWEERRAAYQRDRHARRFDWIELPARFIGGVPQFALGSTILLLIIGFLLAIATKDLVQVVAPVIWLAEATRFTITAVALLWFPFLISATSIAVALLWLIGKNSAEAGEIPWLAHRYNDDHDGDPITPSIVVTAFRDLGIAPLRKAIESMGDAGAAMLSPIVIAGCGVELDVTLPSGTSTKEIQDRHQKLAENMGRHEHEVFITVASKPRTVSLFIADPGALDEPIGPSPMAGDPNVRADYYTGRAPWGETLRGQAATVSLFQQHLLITGKSNQGKTASLRALLLWLAFDVTVEFWIADLKGVGDWSMFNSLAAVLIEGPTDADCMAATHMVEEGVEEMNRRITALKDSDSEEGVTRDMARTPGSGFHPLVIVVDEAQKAFMCPAEDDSKRPYGGNAKDSRFFNGVRALQNQGRAVNVTIHLGTQDPTDRNLPAMVRDPAHLRIALYLATESQAKMALGDAPVKQGAAPHKLRDGLDRGTVICHGPGIEVPRGEPAVTIRTHYIDGKEAVLIAGLAKKRRAKVLTRTGAVELEPARSLLDDLDEILSGRTEKVRLAHLPGLLADLAPGYKPYEVITGEDLAKFLADRGIKTTRPQGVRTLDPQTFRTGLQHLATNDHDDG